MAQTWENQFKCKEEKKTAFVQTMEQVLRRGSEVSVIGNTQNPPGQSLEQPAVDDPQQEGWSAEVPSNLSDCMIFLSQFFQQM